MGLLEKSDWTAQWITGDYTPSKKERYPVDCFSKTFALDKPVKSARLYATACGLYEAKLDGQRVGNFVMAPGTRTIRSGSNTRPTTSQICSRRARTSSRCS